MSNENENNLTYGERLIVCFDDKAESKMPITLENPDASYLEKLNNQGWGIFETANSFFATNEQLKELAEKKGKEKVTKRNKEFLTRLNEVFADLDVRKDNDDMSKSEREQKKNDLKSALTLYCPPSTYVITKNGLQPRWWIDELNIDETTQQKYIGVTNGIIEWSKLHGAKGDPVKDVTRVLRKAGYYHLKSDPYFITEEKGSEKVYTLDELKKYFWFEPKNNYSAPTPPKDNSAITKINALDIRQVVIDVWKERGSEAYFDKDDHLIVDGKATATFRGRLGGNYIATTSSDFPAKGNAVTYVAETLDKSTKEAFKWLCEKYNVENKDAGYEMTLEPITAAELCKKEFSQSAWMIYRLVPENQITVISGAASSFKTMTALDWALGVVSGRKAYGNFDTTQTPVLLISEDGDHEKVLKKRILFLTEEPNDNFYLLIGTGFRVEEKAVEKLIALIKQYGIKFIIFDSFRGIMPPDKDEKDAGAVRQVINRLRPLTAAGATVLIIHHDRKKPVNLRGYTSTDPNDLGEMMSGSADIRGAVDCHLAIGSGKDKKENQFYIIVTQTKCREDELLPAFKVLVVTGKDDEGNTIKMELVYEGEYQADSAEETLNRAKEAILEMLSKSAEKYVWGQVIIKNQPAGLKGRTIAKAFASLEQEGRISSKRGKELGLEGNSNRKYYFMPDETPPLND